MKITFIHGELEEHIFMHQTEGFVIEGKEDHVYRLKKPFYDLKQSLRQMVPKVLIFFMIEHD